jgi:hypothetical protein
MKRQTAASLEECLMTLPVDLFYSFRSSYSYLALPKTAKPAAAPK